MNYSSMLAYMVVSAITPGPNNLICLYLGATSGVRGARKFLSGSMTGLFLKMLLCGLLNVLLARLVPVIMPYLKWFGAAYMLYLGFMMARSGFTKDAETDDSKRESTFMSGILLQCLNVKSWVASLSIYSVYIIPHTSSLISVPIASAVYLIIIIAASLIWCIFGQSIQKVYHKWKLPISILMGLSLVACAITALL